MKLNLPIKLVGLVVLIAAGVTPLTLAGPGSGTAIITPSSNVAAGSSGEWSIVYTAAETHDDGTVRITIPTGWTAPQDGSNSSPGFVTVSTDEPTGSPSLSIAGQVITVAVDTLNAGNSITVVYGNDSASSSARATAATTVGSYSFLVASDPSGGTVSPLSSSPALNVIPTTPASLEIAPDDSTGVVAGSFMQMHVRVLDTFGNRAPVASNRTVNLFATHGQFFDPSNHSTPISSIVITSGTNSKRVDYRGTLVAGSPHTINAFTASGSPSLGGSGFVSLVPGAMSATQSTIVATSPVVADGAAQSTVTVTSRDAFGNLRDSDPVTIDATGNATDVDPGSPTDENGEAVGAVANTFAEIVSVSATVNGVTVTSGNPSVTFIAGPVNAVNSQVTALPTSVVANGAATSTITVTARDANNNPVAGASVVLAATPPGNMTLTQPGGVTGPTGTITGTIASTAIGPRTVTATINGTPVTDDAVVQFTAGPIASFQWTVDGASTAGAFENVTLRVRDAQGNTVTNYTGLVSLSTTTGGSGDGVVQWDAVTPDADGTMTNQSEDDATYQFVASDNGLITLRVTNTRAETFQVRAQDGAISQFSTNIVNGSAAADKIQIVSGNGQSATVNANVSSAPTVLVLDQFDNTVSGAPVTFTALTPNGFADAISGGGLDSTVTTAGNGQIDCDVWRMSTTAGLNRLRARIPAGSTPAVFFTATGTAGPGVNLDIAPNSQSVTQGSSQLVTATLTDLFGNAKSGERVDVVVKSGIGTLTEGTGSTTQLNSQARWGNTDVSGQITVTFVAPGSAGLQSVLDASTSSIGQGSVVDATYTTVASGATNLRITFVGPSTKPANQTFQFLVEAVDGNGNPDTGNNSTVTLTPELGSTVVFSLTDFGATTTTAQLQNGARTIYGRGTLAGDWDITVSGGGLGSDTDVVTITDTGNIDHYFVSSPTPVIAGAAFNVTVEARDVYNNRVMGANNSVTLQAYDDVANNPAQSTLLVPSANLVSGSVVVAEQYTKAELIRVRASASGREGFSNIVTVNAAPAHRIAKISGDGSGIIAGATRSLVAQVLDQYDNPVSGQTVTFAVLNGGGSPSPASGPTDVNGQMSTTLTTGTTVGSNTVKATIDDESPAGLERVDYLVTTVPGPVASFQVVPASFTLTAGTSVGLTITGLDANANLVTNDSSTPIQLTETGNATFGAATGTLASGVFNTTVSDNVAETFTITAQRQGGGASGTSALITVTHAGAYQVSKVTVDPINGVPVGGNQILEVLVRDQYNNPVPSALVTFATTGVINDGSFTDGTGDPNDGIVATLANGHATVTFTTSLTVGANNVNATILDGTPPAQERVTFVVNTVAGGIAYYTVQMSATTATAGQNRNVTISAFDASDNPVDDDVTQVDLLEDLGTGLIFGADPVTLTNGVAVTTVRSNLAQDYRVRAQTLGNAAINGVGQIVTVSPALPAGTITGTADPPTITANGISTSSITSSVITDAFGNKVPTGTQINVSTNRGTIVPAGSKLVNSDGKIEFDLRSSTSPGLATVTMVSQQGTATGTVNVTFAPPSAFTAPNPPTPSVVAPGDNPAFSILVQNTSNTDANLSTATSFTFSDGVRTYSANLASATSIPGPGSQTLVFLASTVDPAFTPGALTPSVVLAGTDEFGAPISATVFGPAGSVLVTSIQIMAINPPGVVSRGQSPTVTVNVKNNGTQSTTINDIDLVFTPGGGLFNPDPITPAPVAAGATVQFSIVVHVDPSCPTGTYTIDAVATGDVGGKTVSDNSIAPFTAPTWQIVAAANLSYVAGSMSPMTVSRGDAYQFRATISNSGAGVVSLDSSLTYIRFTDGTRIFEAHPTQPYAIAGGAQQQIQFKIRAVANAFTPGSYGATFNLQGLESGAPFQRTVTSGGDQVTVQTPAAVTSGTVAPTQVSKGATVAFTVQVTNSGQATVVLTPASTEFRFAGGAFTADLDANSQTTIPPGSSTLTFLPTTVSQAIAANTYPGQLVLAGTENGGAFAQTLNNTGSIVVENAPDIQILATTPSQSPITQDQAKPFKVRMVVRNNGGAAVTFTEASLRFIQAGADRTGQYVVSTPTGFVLGGSTLNGGGATDTVTFNISDNIANAMTAPAMITIQGFLEVEDVNTQQPILAEHELGEFLQVQTPASISVIAVLPTQSTVTQNMAKDFIVRAVVQNTGGSDVNLTLAEPATDAAFSPAAGWAAGPRSALGHGGVTLSGSEVDTVIFDVTSVGTTTGTALISTNYTGTELNSGRSVPGSSSGSASVLVQSEGTVTVASVVSSRSTLTSGASVPYTLTVTLQNTGQSDVNLALPGAIAVAFPGASAAPGYTVPSVLAGGGTLLSGGETDQIVISVDGTGTYSTMGSKAINVTANGVELNSNVPRNGNGGTNVTVQRAPQLDVVGVSPQTVSRGSIVGFAVTIVNAQADAATATLDRFTTRLRFGSNNFNVNLLPASPVDVLGGQQITLLFTPATIVPAIPLGIQNDAILEFHWSENGRTGTENEPMTTPAKRITVQSAPALNIVSVQASRQNVTVQQTAPAWHITMMLTNSNGADVDLDLSGATTYLRLNLLGGGANVTSEYTITQPTALFGGGVRLSSGETDSLIFDVTQAGTTPGNVIVSGFVGGTDVTSQLPVSDNTGDGGSGSFVLQSAGVLNILSMTPEQSTATAGQTGPAAEYTIKMAVRNDGQAAIDLDLSAPTSTAVTFSAPTGWARNLAPALVGGGTVLSGGETDTVVFNVTTTGTAPGVQTISGNIVGFELNTGASRSDNTASGGTGSITVQTPAVLDIVSATPSRATLTSGAATPWDVTVVVENTGQSAARLVLPSGLLVTVQTAASSFDPVNFLQEGGVVLAGGATGTLLVHGDTSPIFSQYGTRNLGVSLDAVELNSNRAFNRNESAVGTVIGQTPPAFQIVSVDPNLVTVGGQAFLRVQVRNNGANAATATLDRGETRVTFGGGVYSAFMQPVSPNVIAANQTVPLDFENKLVSNALTPGTYDLDVDLSFTSNLLDDTELLVAADSITVQNAPQFQILAITTSQPSVTAGQTAPWTVSMEIENSGPADIDINPAVAQTYLRFIRPNGQFDNGYTVVQPTQLRGGGLRLEQGSRDQLDFTITQTGNSTGVIVISGRVGGTDIVQSLPVSDDTFDGGRGSISVVSGAAVSVLATHTSQPRVTAGQTSDWDVRVVVANTGGAAVNLDLGTSIIAFNGGTGWVVTTPPTFLGTGNPLVGGGVDSLVFRVTDTSPNPGTRRIDATIPWQDVNTLATGTATTATSGFGSIVVQIPVDIQITTTTSLSPNPAAVNLGQAFDVRVQVRNNGQADARDVILDLAKTGASTVNPIPPITEVPGGQTVSLDVGVVAANAPEATATFTSSITSVTDENSGQPVTPQPPADNTAVLAIQNPAVFDIINVRPSQSTVTRSQTTPWSVTVRVQNTGGSSAVLNPPAANDLAFAIGGSNKVDYVVQPPTAFASGLPGWNLAGGLIDSLVYNVSVTGADTGLVDITPTLDGSDRNDPTITFSDTGAGTVRVQLPAGVAITSTLPVGTFNHFGTERDTVNTGQEYEIHVTVSNTGEAVDSVLVEMVTDGASQVFRKSNVRQQLGVDDTHVFEFRITSAPNPNVLETFRASILPDVRSHNTGQLINPQPPIDRMHQVVIQRPANLAINLSSVSGAVSPNQLFQMSAVVTNSGQAGVRDTAEFTLIVPPGFVRENPGTEPLTRPFTIGAPVTWLIRAGNAPQPSADFSASISTTPNDRNTGLTAIVSQPSDAFGITVTTGGGLSSPQVVITSPTGAIDAVVSAAQTFALMDSVYATGDTDNVVATLTVPTGFSVVGSSTRNLGNGNDAVLFSSTPFSIIAPATPGVADIYVTFTGVDANNGNPIPSVADTITVTTVPRAALTASAAVTAPPEATDNTVSVGTTFTVTARVDNALNAAGIASPGALTISLPTGYVLNGAEVAVKPFSIGTPVTWQVDAPPQPSGPQQINVTISTVPPDENSGQPANLVDPNAAIAMVTEGSAVAVRDVSANLGIDVGPVPAGTDDVQMLGFEIAYNVSDPSVADARIDSIAVTIIGPDGSPLGPGTVGNTLDKLSIDIGGPAPVDVFDPSSNPVIVSFLSGGGERFIAPDTSRNAIVTLSLSPNPSAKEFSVGLRSGAVCVRDDDSDQRLGVTDSNGQPLDGNITSQPLIVLSSNFEEYVHNYPNPFRAGAQDTRIAYVMDQPGSVSVRIFAIDGSLVYEENIPAGDARAQSGPQETTWDGRNGKGEVVRNGVYVCVLNAGGRSAKFRIAVAK